MLKRPRPQARIAKKRRGSVGRPLAEPKPTVHVSSTCFDGQQRPARHSFHYQTDNPVVRRRQDNIYCYLSRAGTIGDVSVSTFVDRGASFNAIDPSVVERLGLEVVECSKPGFPVYETEAFVMAVPEQKHLLLGMPWLEEVNPEIDWTNKVIKRRGAQKSNSFRQCVRERPATIIAGVRTARRHRSTAPHVSHDDLLMYYTKHTLASASGETRVIAAQKLPRLKLTDGEFCFFVRRTSEKTARQLTTDWDALRGHPVEPIILKYKGKVFVTELPSTPPQRSVDVEAEIELSDTTPVARKQFRLSEEQKEAVRKWTREMLAAKLSVRQNRRSRRQHSA